MFHNFSTARRSICLLGPECVANVFSWIKKTCPNFTKDQWIQISFVFYPVQPCSFFLWQWMLHCWLTLRSWQVDPDSTCGPRWRNERLLRSTLSPIIMVQCIMVAVFKKIKFSPTIGRYMPLFTRTWVIFKLVVDLFKPRWLQHVFQENLQGAECRGWKITDFFR